MENALAAISPSKDLMDAYFSLLEQLERNGTIDDDEATLLRVDQYAREELMHETLGDRNNLSDKAIENIRYRLNERSRSEGIQAGIEKTQIAYSLLIDKQKNLVCEEAETEVKAEFAIKEKRQVLIGR